MNRSALRYGFAQKCQGIIEIATIKARKLPNVYPVKTGATHDCEPRILTPALFESRKRFRYLAEVPRSNRQVAEQRREIGQAMSDHVQHIPLALQFTAHQE
jgi:hypothetical protein